jgi:hypothetical protein
MIRLETLCSRHALCSFSMFCLVGWIHRACCPWTTWTLPDTSIGEAIFYGLIFTALITGFTSYLTVNFVIVWVGVVVWHFTHCFVILFAFPIQYFYSWHGLQLFRYIDSFSPRVTYSRFVLCFCYAAFTIVF